MHYSTDFETLDGFYDSLYSIPARLNRDSTTPQAVTANLLRELNDPQKKFRSVLITGSKGKGSTALLLSSLISSTRTRVGRFISPHLFDYRERIVVDNDMIKPEELLRLGKTVFDVANALDINHPDEFPRFFEITTAIAYLYFAQRYVDIAVIETGIGALTDATNQHIHELSILTNIEDQHGDIFGTLTDIAEEKSGVIKAETPLILGDLPEEVDQMILDYAANLNVPVTRYKRRFLPNNNSFYQLKVGDKFWISESLNKGKNAWVALTAFNKLSLELSDDDKITALNNTALPARQEIISTEPFVIIDSAHSGESAKSLANHVKKSVASPIRKTVLLLSFSSEKNILPVFSAFADADKIVLTQATISRSLTPETIADVLKPHTKAKIKLITNPEEAFEKTRAKLKPNDVLVVTGSVYLAGLISKRLHDK